MYFLGSQLGDKQGPPLGFGYYKDKYIGSDLIEIDSQGAGGGEEPQNILRNNSGSVHFWDSWLVTVGMVPKIYLRSSWEISYERVRVGRMQTMPPFRKKS